MAHFYVNQSTVSKLLIKARVHGYMKDHLGSGCPHVINANDDAYIINEIQVMPSKNSRMLRDQLHTHNQCQVSLETIQILLHAANIKACLGHSE